MPMKASSVFPNWQSSLAPFSHFWLLPCPYPQLAFGIPNPNAHQAAFVAEFRVNHFRKLTPCQANFVKSSLSLPTCPKVFLLSVPRPRPFNPQILSPPIPPPLE